MKTKEKKLLKLLYKEEKRLYDIIITSKEYSNLANVQILINAQGGNPTQDLSENILEAIMYLKDFRNLEHEH